MAPLSRLLPFLRPYRGRIALAFLALCVAAGATLALPVAFKLMIDLGFSRGAASEVDRAFAGLFVVSVVLALATALRYYLVSWLGERVTADLRRAVYAHVLGLSPRFFETLKTGEVLSRLTADTTLVQTVVGSSLSLGLRNAFMLVGGLAMLVVTSPVLSAWVLGLLLFVLLPILLFGRVVRRLSRASQDRVADSSAMAGETLNAIQTVQAYAQEARESARFAETVERSFAAALSRVRARAGLTAAVILMMFGSIVLVLWQGARSVLAGTMSGGELGQFVLYAVIVGGAVGAIAEVWGELQRAAGATERLLELLAAERDIDAPPSPAALPPRPASVRFADVSFAYPSRPGQPALDGFSLEVRPGETVALVGPSGAGKSTVFQLLLRFYDPQQGRVLVDGIDVRAVDPVALRERIGLVSQDNVVFSADAGENIRYARPEANEAAVQAAAEAAAADGFVRELPEGYATFLGERGVRLSGGQRQRIAIARAILKNPSIMLLDEATSALDAESERLVQGALEHAAQGRTTLVIAHRLATVQRADRIVVMDRGRVVAIGSHAELIAQGGLYARLAALQFAA